MQVLHPCFCSHLDIIASLTVLEQCKQHWDLHLTLVEYGRINHGVSCSCQEWIGRKDGVDWYKIHQHHAVELENQHQCHFLPGLYNVNLQLFLTECGDCSNGTLWIQRTSNRATFQVSIGKQVFVQRSCTPHRCIEIQIAWQPTGVLISEKHLQHCRPWNDRVCNAKCEKKLLWQGYEMSEEMNDLMLDVHQDHSMIFEAGGSKSNKTASGQLVEYILTNQMNRHDLWEWHGAQWWVDPKMLRPLKKRRCCDVWVTNLATYVLLTQITSPLPSTCKNSNLPVSWLLTFKGTISYSHSLTSSFNTMRLSNLIIPSASRATSSMAARCTSSITQTNCVIPSFSDAQDLICRPGTFPSRHFWYHHLL